MKNILIINGHPDKNSLCCSLAETYKEGCKSNGANCTLVNLADLHFDPILHHGYKQRTELEPDLVKMQEAILKADHLVFVYPTWWGTYPALLKGFIDRVFLPGFAFKYRENSLFWDKYFKGKTARLIVTMDTPKWYYSLVYKSPGHNSLRKGILEFCGIKPVRISVFGPVKTSDDKKRSKWLSQVRKLGAELK
ncbi:NAD(P)H-dependent oxidoreductase [Marinilabilia sp.]|uniref:NAD(P)H-dependent oxidoreductase n=1 Tax=Marinilabilia sp. TaxID=2021252 RepID=UPI0025BBE3C9|nr:NAD(P)H-dependent oxidoreductase [Marinilabilia sp.]